MYFKDACLTRVPSPRGRAFQYIIAIEGIGPVPLIYVEDYSSLVFGSVGRVDFYGAFFHFREFLPTPVLRLFNVLESLYMSLDSSIRCTRIDVALDFSCALPQNIHDYILPDANSKRGLRVFYDSTRKINSASYLSKKNSGYGVRVYNKLLDISQK